jgi:hypothetical protein
MTTLEIIETSTIPLKKIAKVAKVANDVSASFYMKQISKTDIRLWMDMMMIKKKRETIKGKEIFILYI